MCKNEQIILTYAESIKAELLYDIKVNVSATVFFRADFEEDQKFEKKLCDIIHN